ncbi:MOSC domain-containing protein [Parerythrobacter lacustris]|uniref:MOSC domain-containing protein n=1 Tax=Parerythrobacter lacustris TaxID=2969984 RepID=A0ABT1XS86_9SPHN|nr:MOSC domain-containing protein [Parerythrobacter lacustris]MCR2834521.1 MOSC domain-containing protein [Parerythrobacter lacustris]
MNPIPVEALCVGQPAPFRDGELSAFAKTKVDGPVRITREGLKGDTQADRRNHGGQHMAVHLYPRSHRAFWLQKIGAEPLLDEPGAFGTNLAVDGLAEADVMLGDRFRLGSALLEISQPRMPCWKIEHHFGHKGMVAAIIASARCGWYFRVIEEGEAQADDILERVEAQRTDWTVAEVFAELANPKSATTLERVKAMADCELLSPVWRGGARQKAEAMGG